MLQDVWRLCGQPGQPSTKYLAAVMDDILGRLVPFEELGKVADQVSDAVLAELGSMSAATIDRYLKPHKDSQYPVALSGTKPSHILRSQVPIRTSMSEPITAPGFLELDTVAQCGHTLVGEFLWTLSATDPLTSRRGYSDGARAELLAMSAATIDRFLAPAGLGRARGDVIPAPANRSRPTPPAQASWLVPVRDP